MSKDNTIFEFANQFGYDSPFGDWLKQNKQNLERQALARVRNGKPQTYSNTLPLETKKTARSEDCGSMIVLSNIVNPTEGVPGRATIKINMDYRIVSKGEGAVVNKKVISTREFRMLFSKGNRIIQLKNLPSVQREALILNQNEMDLTKINTNTGIPGFWNYYEVKVVYNFKLKKQNFLNLEKRKSLNLWNGIRWLNDCIESRGLIMLVPYETYFQEWYDAQKKSLSEIRRGLLEGDRENKTIEELRQIRTNYERELGRKTSAQFMSFIIQNLILDNLDRYRDKSIFVRDSALFAGNEFISQDQRLTIFLKEINATFKFDEFIDEPNEKWVELQDFSSYYFLVVSKIYKFIGELYSGFHRGGDEPEIGAAGNNESRSEVNFILLNPKYYGNDAIGRSFNFSGLSATEILVHEAGHNSAKKFVHTAHATGDYEYDQQGLQSNRHGAIYPSYENTLDIINDETNRKNMSVI